MAQVTILATVDAELGVELSDDSMTKFQSVGELLNILRSKGAIEDS
jgi:acyl carrier protein